MAENNQEPTPPRRTYGQLAKQAGLFMLFGTILLIPRIRRLRRRVWAWTCVRLAVAACGGWLVWRYAHAQAGAVMLTWGIVFLAFSLLIGAKPAVKSMDVLTDELGALLVLNGGVFRHSPDSAPIRDSKVFVHPEQIIVLGPSERRLLEIPLGKVRNLAAHRVTNGSVEGREAWEVEINWLADVPCTTTFHYEGVFAEHLARVSESTLRGQWKKDLPVIHP